MTERLEAETITPQDPEPRASLAADQPQDLSLSFDDIVAARARIAEYIHRTPIMRSTTLSRLTQTDLYLKPENLQRTGSFKVRGAVNAVLQLSAEQRQRGIITLSAGNHGQGLAYAAKQLGVRCVVFMPETAVPTKIDAIREYGAETMFAPTMEQVYDAMAAFRERDGLHYVHPFADPAIIAGQGTIALELLEDIPDLESVVVCVGGGGMLAGIALGIKSQRPDVRIVGVEPDGAPAVSLSLAAGKPVTLEQIDTVADGLAAPFAGALSQAVIERYVDDIVLVTDDEIVTAMRLVIERMKLLVEPAGAAAIAALLTGKAGVPTGSITAATLSGGNVDREKLKRLL